MLFFFFDFALEMASEIPVTYVPARNTVYLNLSMIAHEIAFTTCLRYS